MPRMCASSLWGSEAGHFPGESDTAAILRNAQRPAMSSQWRQPEPVLASRNLLSALPGLGPCSTRWAYKWSSPHCFAVATQPHQLPQAAELSPSETPSGHLHALSPGLLFRAAPWSRAPGLPDHCSSHRGGCRHHPSDGCPGACLGRLHTGLQERVHSRCWSLCLPRGHRRAAQ